MSNNTGISFFDDDRSAIVTYVSNGLLIQVMTLRQDGTMNQCAIALTSPQVIELIEFLQPGTFTDNKDIFNED